MERPHPDGTHGAHARERALRGLVERGVLSPEQAEAVRDALEEASPTRPRVRWVEIAGYVGGGLVLAGAFTLVATSWEEMTTAARAALLGTLTLALIVGGVVTAGGPHAMVGPHHRVTPVRLRITGVLLALAAATTALAVTELTTDTGFPVNTLSGSLAGLTVAVAGYAVLPSAVGLVACWLLSALAVDAALDGPEITAGAETLVHGAAYLALGLVLGILAECGVLPHRRLGLGLGAAIALFGAQLPLLWGAENVWGYTLTLILSAVLLGYYHWQSAAGPLLVFGILGVALAVPELVWDWTDGTIGAAAVLLISGAVLLLVSGVGVRLHRSHRR